MGSRAIRIPMLCVGLWVAAGVAPAALITWTGGTSTNFETAGNWTGTPTPPTNNTSTDTADLSNAPAGIFQPLLTMSRSLLGLDFSVAGGGYTLFSTGSAYTLTVGAGGIDSSGAGGTNTVGLRGNITVIGTSTWTINNALVVNSVVYAGSSTDILVKDGAGTLTLGAVGKSVYGSANLGAGTLRLAGGQNTLLGGGRALVVNGGTLDLNDCDQRLESLSGAGGVITNTGSRMAMLSTYVNGAAKTFSGQIRGNTGLMYNGLNVSNVLNGGENDYTGPTYVTGTHTTAALNLSGSASITQSSEVNLNFGILSLSNTATYLASRLGDAVPINLRGGGLQYLGNAGTASTETLGAVNVLVGSNVVEVRRGTGNASYVTATSLNRGADRGILCVYGTEGSDTLGTTERFRVSDNPPAVSDGMVAPWIVRSDVDGHGGSQNFLTYDSTVDANGAVGFKVVTYDLTNTFVGADGTKKVTLTAASNLAADAVVKVLRTSGNLTGSGNLLTITSGGLMSGLQGDSTIDPNLKFGAAGDVEAIVYATPTSTSTTTLGGTLTTSAGLTKGGAGILKLMQSAATWSGTTTVNEGKLTFDAAAADGTVFIPGDLTLSGTMHRSSQATVAMTAANQIASTAIVTLNGNAKWDLAGKNQTVAGVRMNGYAYTANLAPLEIASGAGTLTVAGDISAAYTTNYAGGLPTISGKLALDTSVTRTITVDSGFEANQNGLAISATLYNTGGTAGFTKAGPGTLYLSADNLATFTGPITVTGGVLRGGFTTTGQNPLGAATNAIALQANGAVQTDSLTTNTTLSLGDVTFAGGNSINVGSKNGTSIVTLNSLARASGTRATATIVRVLDVAGNNEYLKVAGWSTLPATSMVDAWYVGASGALDSVGDFLTYGANGFVKVTYDAGTDINTAGSTAVFDANEPQALSGDASLYALRTSYDVTGSGSTLTLAGDPAAASKNAGLIVNWDNTIDPDIQFGSGAGGDAEGLVFVRYHRTATLAGQISTAVGLTKFGPGTLVLAADNSSNTLDGLITVNGGALVAGVDGALGLADVTILPGTTLDLSAGGLTDAIDDAAVLTLSKTDWDLYSVVAFGSSTYVETVGELWVNGVQKGPGTYGAAELPGYVTGSGSLRVVPEPATLGLLALGLAGLAALRRRR